MKRFIGILVIAVFAIGFFTAAVSVMYLPDRKITPNSSTEEFAAYLDLRIPELMGLYEIPGANIALVKDGRIAYTAAYGDADL